MQRLSVSLCGILVCLNAVGGANLPAVDVSHGGISARAIFGEEIISQQKTSDVSVAPVAKKKTARKIVSRVAKQQSKKVASSDVLTPKKPSSDLWANNDAPLRMPRMDEIRVVSSDSALPEESLFPTRVVDNDIATRKQNLAKAKAAERATLEEIKSLRQEIARLNAAQKKAEEKIAAARPTMVKIPVSGQTEVKTVSESKPAVSTRREIVPMETKKDVVVRAVSKNVAEPKMAAKDDSMTKMSPNELKKAFKKTYLSENKHLSAYSIDDRFDVASDMTSDIEGFSAQRDLSEMSSDVRPLEVKITFFNDDAGLSRENYNLLSETASIVVNNPKRAIQIAIPESVTYNKDSRKLAARRLAIVEQVLKDTGVAERRIVPVLSQRNDDVFVLRVISGEVFETLTEQKRNMFGDNISKKTYKSMSW